MKRMVVLFLVLGLALSGASAQARVDFDPPALQARADFDPPALEQVLEGDFRRLVETPAGLLALSREGGLFFLPQRRPVFLTDFIKRVVVTPGGVTLVGQSGCFGFTGSGELREVYSFDYSDHPHAWCGRSSTGELAVLDQDALGIRVGYPAYDLWAEPEPGTQIIDLGFSGEDIVFVADLGDSFPGDRYRIGRLAYDGGWVRETLLESPWLFRLETAGSGELAIWSSVQIFRLSPDGRMVEFAPDGGVNLVVGHSGSLSLSLVEIRLDEVFYTWRSWLPGEGWPSRALALGSDFSDFEADGLDRPLTGCRWFAGPKGVWRQQVWVSRTSLPLVFGPMAESCRIRVPDFAVFGTDISVGVVCGNAPERVEISTPIGGEFLSYFHSPEPPAEVGDRMASVIWSSSPPSEVSVLLHVITPSRPHPCRHEDLHLRVEIQGDEDSRLEHSLPVWCAP
ncbi:MAG: hypothetical protein JW991_00450 [Candidatus Pacebacteria bacterium]|nr:hypothetical protein [Candidatus Paceibacterota bacterium]